MRLIEVSDDVIVAMSQEELRLIASSIGEALEAVDDWEFQTRLGAEPGEARSLQAEFNAVYHLLLRGDDAE